jgi:hypothetical protein
MNERHHIRRTAIALALAAVAAPVARAADDEAGFASPTRAGKPVAIHPNDRPGALGGLDGADVIFVWTTEANDPVTIRPDDRRGVVRGPGAVDVGQPGLPSSIYPNDRPGIVRGPGPQPIATAARFDGDGFHWRDFGIGAAASLGLALMLLGLGASVLRAREDGGDEHGPASAT